MIGIVAGFRAWAARNGYDTDGSSNDDITSELVAATSVMSRMTGRILDPVTNAVTTLRGHGQASLAIPDMLSVTAVTLDDLPVPLTDLIIKPEDKEPKRLLEMVNGIWPLNCIVRVAGTLGYMTSLPQDLVDATYALAAGRLYETDGEVERVSIQGISVAVGKNSSTQASIPDVVQLHSRRLG